MEVYALLLGSSAVVLSTAGLVRSARRLYLATRAERELVDELYAHHRNQVKKWSDLLATADPDSTAVHKIQREFERVVSKRLHKPFKEQVIDALRQPSDVGREMYLRKLVAESQTAETQKRATAAAH